MNRKLLLSFFAAILSLFFLVNAFAHESINVVHKEFGKSGLDDAAGAGSQGFRSFDAFKRAMGPAGEGKNWHHLVEQTPGNLSRFGPDAIHNTNNLMRVDAAIHNRISGYYSSIQDFSGGLTVRQWLSTQSFEAQSAFAIKTLQNFGVLP